MFSKYVRSIIQMANIDETKAFVPATDPITGQYNQEYEF